MPLEVKIPNQNLRGREMRFISLPAINKRVSLKAYVRAIKLARDNPDAEFKHGLTTWWSTTGDEIMRQFRDGMHDRINAGVRYVDRGISGAV